MATTDASDGHSAADDSGTTDGHGTAHGSGTADGQGTTDSTGSTGSTGTSVRMMSRGQRIRHFMKDFRVRALLTLLLLVVIAFAARGHYHLFADGWDAIKSANNWYVTAAAVAMLAAMVAQAEVMVVLVRSAGVAVKRTTANALGLAANAWSSTFPGGPAISAAMIFREQLKWGATPVIASWYMVLSGALSGAGMAILGFGAMFFLSADVHPYSMAFTLVILCLLAWGMNWVAKHPEKVEAWLLRVITWFNRKRHAPEDRWHDKVVGLADQLSAVELPPKKLLWSVVLSLLNWIAEILCLMFCVHAVGATPSIAGVVLAFITAKLVGQAQVTPGGLGPVDAALVGMLVGAAQMGSSTALAAVVVFRMISFLGLAIIGWLVFLWTFVRDSVDNGHSLSLRQIISGSAARGENANSAGGEDATTADGDTREAAGADAGADTAQDAGDDADAGSDTDSGTGSGTAPGTGPDTGSDTGAGTETGTDTPTLGKYRPATESELD